MADLINYGKHVDLHNNGKLVYTDMHKASNKQLDTGDENLWSISFIEPIKDFDRNKSYYRPPMTEEQKLNLEEAQASMHWKDESYWDEMNTVDTVDLIKTISDKF